MSASQLRRTDDDEVKAVRVDLNMVWSEALRPPPSMFVDQTAFSCALMDLGEWLR